MQFVWAFTGIGCTRLIKVTLIRNNFERNVKALWVSYFQSYFEHKFAVGLRIGSTSFLTEEFDHGSD
tara:strand:+ start:340 stop:540 length:201 start_codon:yes stop_codon:yes gene_type:complete